MNHKSKLLPLFLQFLKFGCFTFGGGWSIVAQMRKVYVEDQQAISDEDLLDLTSVGHSLPGTMIGNIAVLFGYRQAGMPGSLLCLLGLSLPPFIILSLITVFYTAFRDSYWVAAAMTGVRAAVVPIILSTAIPLIRKAFRLPPCVLVALLSFILFLVFGVSCVWLVVIGAVCGLVISHFYPEGGGEA